MVFEVNINIAGFMLVNSALILLNTFSQSTCSFVILIFVHNGHIKGVPIPSTKPMQQLLYYLTIVAVQRRKSTLMEFKACGTTVDFHTRIYKDNLLGLLFMQ